MSIGLSSYGLSLESFGPAGAPGFAATGVATGFGAAGSAGAFGSSFGASGGGGSATSSTSIDRSGTSFSATTYPAAAIPIAPCTATETRKGALTPILLSPSQFLRQSPGVTPMQH